MPAEINGPLTGVVVATVTPLADGGRQVDQAAVPALADFYAGAGASGVFVAGTTGEGLLLHAAERIALTERFVDCARGRLAVVAHVGAQTTAEAVTLAEHAREAGVNAVAAVGPPYYSYDDAELLAHFQAVAGACAPVPFYLYEFRERTGYALSESVVVELQKRAPNLVGMKVSDRHLAEVREYMLAGLDVLVGSEPLIPEALALGAVGAVSGLAAGLPHAVVRIFQGLESGAHAESLRAALAGYPFQAALKTALVAQGVLDDASVRAPLRGLTASERDGLWGWLAGLDIAIARDATAENYETSPAA
jgi:N-acetylneuraminate lyase